MFRPFSSFLAAEGQCRCLNLLLDFRPPCPLSASPYASASTHSRPTDLPPPSLQTHEKEGHIVDSMSTCTEHSRAELYTLRMKPRPVYALHDSSQAVLSLPPETFGHSDSSQVYLSLLPTATILYLVRSMGADRAKTTARLFNYTWCKVVYCTWCKDCGKYVTVARSAWGVHCGHGWITSRGSTVHALYTVLRPGHPAH